MTAKYIDGKAVAARMRAEIRDEVVKFKEQFDLRPGLATVLVGDDSASATYVRSKRKASAEVGIESFPHELPASATQEEVETLVGELNNNPAVHGILAQLPLPGHLNEQKILDHISIKKDVDGLHPANVGLLAMKGREPYFVACTPSGIMILLDEIGVEVAGKRAVVVGRSNIVGVPMAHLLNNANATVTIAHSRTPDLAGVCREADILVVAIGRAEMVRGDWVKSGAVVIDVGVNRVDDPSHKRGYRLTGDVATEEVAEVASAITPVPGGVGPMTIAMLLNNTLRAAKAVASRG